VDLDTEREATTTGTTDGEGVRMLTDEEIEAGAADVPPGSAQRGVGEP